MSTVMPVPTLTDTGWIYADAAKIDHLMVYFFLTDELQSSLYGSQISSLPAILKNNPKNMTQAAEEVRVKLFTYLQAYYEAVSVNVSVTETDPEASLIETTMTITANITINGVQRSVGKILTILDGQMQNFIDINNA